VHLLFEFKKCNQDGILSRFYSIIAVRNKDKDILDIIKYCINDLVSVIKYNCRENK